jgi:hypothetical protein
VNQPLATAIQLFLGSLVACSVAACSTVTQPAQSSPLPPTETVYSATPDWKQYSSDSLRLTFAYPANWSIQVADNFIQLSSPDRAGFEADSELAYFVFIGERANPERRPFSEIVTEGLSEELRQAFRFTSVQIGDYLTHQTESLPSRAGALEVFFEDGDRYVEFGLAPYDSQNPIIGQDRHAKLFEALLKTVRLIK